VDGERAIRIGNPSVDEAQPAWSPDGANIAVVSSRDQGGTLGMLIGFSRAMSYYLHGSGGDLFVMPALGGTARKISSNAYDPAWSPDGKSIAYRAKEVDQWRLFIASVETRRSHLLKQVQPRSFSPSWSADGRWLAYVHATNLFVTALVDGLPSALTGDKNSAAFNPVWSADSRYVYFSSNRKRWIGKLCPQKPAKKETAAQTESGVDSLPIAGVRTTASRRKYPAGRSSRG
jgi:Tol biopolymer transport system component